MSLLQIIHQINPPKLVRMGHAPEVIESVKADVIPTPAESINVELVSVQPVKKRGRPKRSVEQKETE